MYDFLIIGAGSAGAHSTYFLARAGAKVLVVDQGPIAGGASSAAGAFISPRLGRGGPLQKITNEAFRFTTTFYKEKFPHLFAQTGILRLPKDADDAKKFADYEPFIDVAYEKKTAHEIDFLKPYASQFGGYYFPQGGIAQARELCLALLEGVEFRERKVERIEEKEGFFACDGVRAERVIVAAGAWEELLPPYIKLGKLAGYRFDILADLELPVSVHKRISISKKIDGKMAVGATHTRVDGIHCPPPGSFLIDEARRMAELGKVELLQMFCGVRPSVNDHFPYVGEVVDVEAALKRFPSLPKGEKVPPQELPRQKGLYIIGGFGGRGFVFGSFVANLLARHLLHKEPLPKDLDADRLFFRWVKKSIMYT